MSEPTLPDDLARLEAALERRPREPLSASMRKRALANVHGARALERRLLQGAAAAVAILALGGGLTPPQREEGARHRPTRTARVQVDMKVLEQMGFDPVESRRAALVLAAASVPCIAPATGSAELLGDALRGP